MLTWLRVRGCVVRGGSYQDRGLMLRNNHRYYMSQDETAPTVGLRLAQDL